MRTVNDAVPEHWDPLVQKLHWLMAALLVAQWVGGKAGEAMRASPLKIDVMLTHKSTGIVLLIALGTVALQASRAARANPVDALRYE